jgi:hypothetical protein
MHYDCNGGVVWCEEWRVVVVVLAWHAVAAIHLFVASVHGTVQII